mgnify:CR=1 FL=1
MHQQGIRMEGMSDLNALNLEPGEVVGGYTLISRLGSGAMGSVWRVRDDGGTTYAMKILRDSLTDESVAGSGSASTALHDPDLKPDVTPRERLRSAPSIISGAMNPVGASAASSAARQMVRGLLRSTPPAAPKGGIASAASATIAAGIGRFRYRDGRGRKSRDPHRPSDGYTRIHRTRDY